MPQPLALCVEDLDATSEATRYVCCVAISGAEHGLGVTNTGTIVWRNAEPTACNLWISADEQLILLRPEGAHPVIVRRGGRSLDVPYDKPVVLLNQDSFEVGHKHLRVHVHGPAPAITPPEPYVPARASNAARFVAMVAIGAAVVGCKKAIDVRDAPPSAAVPEEPHSPGTGGTDAGIASVDASDASADSSPPAADASAAASSAAPASPGASPPTAPPTATPVEVRAHPPKPALPPKDGEPL